MKLRIAYLMEDTDLSGGVRVQLAQSDELVRRGHDVTIVTRGAPLRWRSSFAQWSHVGDFSEIDPGEFDFLIATFWTTVRPAFDLAPGKTLHLCQGYEGDFTAYQDHSGAIEAVYRLPIPKIVVTPTLVPLCRRYCDDVTWIGQIVDEGFFQPREPHEAAPRVLLVGASQIDFKGIDVGYGAALHARWNGGEFDLVRVSPWAPAGDEPVQEHVTEFHVGLDSLAMQRLFRSCDLFLGPSRRNEGFGLPAAEAMASGLPTVLTRIPSFLSFAPGEDYALFADENDAETLGEHLLTLFADERVSRELSRRGREVAEQFRADRTGERLEEFLLGRFEGRLTTER
jgi:glycosyltransferase involved in cell wall biosynthesis